MNKSPNTNSRFNRSSKRLGVSLIEVIACTALVAIMIVPIAGVIRASGQAIAQSDLDTSTEAKMRRGLCWLSDSIRDGQLLGVGSNEMKLTLNSGLDVKIMIGGGQIDEQIREYTGADVYGRDAMAAVALAKEWMKE